MLSVASGVRIDYNWMATLRQGTIPDGFEIYAYTSIAMPKGYHYGVTMMSTKRWQMGCHLTTFAMPGLAFAVIRTPDPLGQVGPFPRQYPTPLASSPNAEIDLSNLHGEYLSRITGLPYVFTGSSQSGV